MTKALLVKLHRETVHQPGWKLQGELPSRSQTPSAAHTLSHICIPSSDPSFLGLFIWGPGQREVFFRHLCWAFLWGLEGKTLKTLSPISVLGTFPLLATHPPSIPLLARCSELLQQLRNSHPCLCWPTQQETTSTFSDFRLLLIPSQRLKA